MSAISEVGRSNKKKKTITHKEAKRKKRLLTILTTGLFVVLCFIIFFPILAGFLASFRPGQTLIRYGLNISTNLKDYTLSNYIYLFTGNHNYFVWYVNSLILTAVTIIFTLLVCYFIAYGLSMYQFKLKNFLFFLVIATMMVPFEILMLPLYKEIIELGLVDTMVGVILPGLCGASTIFFFRQYMLGLPKDLLDAGRIDGATEYGISIRIMMPLAKPAFASMAILVAMGSWNSILWPMLVYRSAEKFTITIGLNTLLTPYGNNYDLLIAGSMFALIPVFIVFLIFQKYFVEGMTTGAIKG